MRAACKLLGPIRQNMPDHHCQLSRGCDGRRGRAPIPLDPVKERPQRTWRRLRGPRRLDKHLAGVRVSLLAGWPVARRAIARLANLLASIRSSNSTSPAFRIREISPIEAKTVDATTGPIPGIVIRRSTRGFSSASPMIVMSSLAS